MKWESALKSFQSPYLTKVGKFCAVLKDSNVKKGHLGILRAQIDPSQVFATHCNHKQGEKGKQNTFITIVNITSTTILGYQGRACSRHIFVAGCDAGRCRISEAAR